MPIYNSGPTTQSGLISSTGNSKPDVGHDIAKSARGVTGSTGFRMVFDPLGIFDTALAKFAPDDPLQESPEAKAAREAQTNAEDAKLAQYQKQYEEFLAHLNAPLDANDPQVHAMIANAQASANRDAQAHGLRGGLASSNVAQQALNTQALMQGQRQQLYQQGLANLNDWNAKVEAFKWNRNNTELQQRNAILQQLYNDKQQKMAGIEGLAGTIIGGIFGGPGGAQAGAGLGKIGGAQGAGANPYSVNYTNTTSGY